MNKNLTAPMSNPFRHTNHLHVVGGQFGSEGKGRVVQAICRSAKVDVAIRIGGPQAGHTFYYEGEKFVFKQVPIPVMWGAVGVIGRNAVVDPVLLTREIGDIKHATGFWPRVIVDPRAVILESHHKDQEQLDGLVESIGSTATGVGAARSAHIMRTAILAKNHEFVAQVDVADTVPIIRGALNAAKRVLFEGTQGLGLSLSASGYYPYVTSADLTPLQSLASLGLGVQDVINYRPRVVGVFRTFPIRVGGNSGPLTGEMTWDGLQASYNEDIPVEKTTVTNRIRRVGAWDADLARRMIEVGGVTDAVYTFLDYLGYEPYTHKQWLAARELELGIPTLGYSTGNGSTEGTFQWAMN